MFRASHFEHRASHLGLHRRGFTLVEMLVSVALVLLIMTLFAQAFGIAAGSIRTSRGIAENDQRARSMVTILLGDLRKRTYRQRGDAVTETIVPSRGTTSAGDVQLIQLENMANRNSLGIVPLHPDYFNGGNGGAAKRIVDKDRERGYFYYSEGDPTNDADDVLQFTVDTSITELGNHDTTPMLGRARPIGSPGGPGGLPTWDSGANAPLNRDQPIWDDLKGFQFIPGVGPMSYQPGDTGTSKSRYAEISYFLRAGKLYRRVMLIRDPPQDIVDADKGEGQPNFDGPLGGIGGGAKMIARRYNPGAEDGSPTQFNSSDFWNDFDFSAQFYPPGAPTPGPTSTQVYFAEPASLDNTIAGVNDGRPNPRYFSLGNPQNRFGHDAAVRNNGFQGQPKEYYDPTDPSTRFGRFTQEETSHPRFRYPGFPSYIGGADSPMAPAAMPGIADGNFNGVADAFEPGAGGVSHGPRRGEDILLSNCHGFDVKVWDDVVGAFVDIGHGLTDSTGSFAGDYHTRQLTDTSRSWNPTQGTDNPGFFQAAGQGMANYGGLLGPNNRVFDTWHPAFDFNTTREGRPGAANGTGSADDVPPFRPLWSERDNFTSVTGSGGSPYLNGAQAQPLLYNPQGFNSGGTYAQGQRVFPRPDQNDPYHPHQSFFYVATPNPSLPPGNLGTMLTDFQITGTPSEPRWPETPGGTVADGQILWKAVPNTIGLKAIQITVRFYDPTSGQIRQLTMTHSFVEL